jgi:hypothetical protein
MDTASLHHLADPANLRAFIDALSHMAGASELAVLGATAVWLERQLRRQADDMKEVGRLGRLLQAVRAEAHSARRGG